MDGINLPNWILALPKELLVIGIASLPILELRAAIPIGCKLLGISALGEVYFLSLLGNLIPVFPLLLFFKYFFHKLQDMAVLGGFFRWWFKRVKRKSKLVERWGFWGLVLFVAIPLPVTGAWTGTIAANLFKIKIKRAFLAIFFGIIIAGVAVSLIVAGTIGVFFVDK